MYGHRNKSKDIEAMLFEDSDDSVMNLIEFTNGNFTPHAMLSQTLNSVSYDYALIETKTGSVRVDVGDYIVRDLQGEFYLKKRKEFNRMHKIKKR